MIKEETLTLTRREDGRYWYGEDVARFPSRTTMTRVCDVLAMENYSGRESENRYEFISNVGDPAIVVVNYDYDRQNGTIEFIYGTPDARQKLKDKIKRILGALGCEQPDFRR